MATSSAVVSPARASLPRGVGVGAALLLSVLTTLGAVPARAQLTCDEDAGDEAMCADDDAGIGQDAGSDPDAGLGDGGVRDGGADAGTPAEPYVECSCEAVVHTGNGLIHVCTESFEPDVCPGFACTRGSVRQRACGLRGRVELCCEIESRGLQTHLYEDCDHPNCESGFRAQCRDFGGRVLEGACSMPERPDDFDDGEDDDGGFCSVSTPGASKRRAGWLALGVPLWLARYRRRRSSTP